MSLYVFICAKVRLFYVICNDIYMLCNMFLYVVQHIFGRVLARPMHFLHTSVARCTKCKNPLSGLKWHGLNQWPLKKKSRAIAGTAKGWPCATILPVRQWSTWRTASLERTLNVIRSAPQFCERHKKNARDFHKPRAPKSYYL